MPNAFAARVIAAVRRVPPGRVATYGGIARAAGRPRAWRAVGAIMGTWFSSVVTVVSLPRQGWAVVFWVEAACRARGGAQGGSCARPRPGYSMSPLRARVERGRIRLDEPTSLPDGTVLTLVMDDEGDDLDERDRLALAAAIEHAAESARLGRLRPASDIVSELRRD